MSEIYAVIGNPVAHSKSPQIHVAFAQQTTQVIEYKKIFCEIGAFKETLLAFRAAGGKGANVTVPFKHDAFEVATRRSARAQQAGAVNTLSFAGDEIIGDNTDGVGLTRDLKQNLGCVLHGKSILLLGAGGASFGVVGPLLEEQPEMLIVANRTLSKAQALVQRYATLAAGNPLAASSFAALSGKRFNVVINATSAGLTNSMPELPENLFAPGALAYDMVYGKLTPFMQFAQAHHTRVADGLGMLVEQAAESFYLWHGVRPQTSPVIALLRSGG